MEQMKKSKRLRSFSLFFALIVFYGANAQQNANDTTFLYYELGQLKSKGMLVDGKRDGIWISYYPSGVKNASEAYRQGALWGKCIYYYPNGKLKAVETWIHGYQEGEAKYYFDNGILYRVGQFKDGVYEGEWITNHENGILRQKGAYLGGLPIGKWSFYDPKNTLIKTEVFPDRYGLKWDSITVVKYYYPGEQVMLEGKMKNGKETGEWIIYKKNGKVKERVIY